ncbi:MULTISPECIES: GGDEF domain-containing protein [unclassified Cyanobium]|uniref:GGDEF domain-containing protein n=1 Tax=unclassified Cyanobium TaxID=2627006 RepID=UPI0020CDAE35|nr:MULTISPECIES: diguanylate cyclase [unclassified Cyanobium]MCP9777938.1 diguanylate cyclase [Cyanobium sp. Tous-M-B4]MCP9875563.1 diguanylate cyclase [Cyanobium sp. A2C-AMD]
MPYPDYPIPADESQRQRDLERLGVLNHPGDEHFERLVRLASTVLETPIALISLVDGDRQWFLAHHGIDSTETPRKMAFCAHAIAGDETLVVPDARQDPRFCTNPLVIQDPKVRFYAGTPLQSRDGHNLGTLCVIDRLPRHFSSSQVRLLEDLAQLVLRELELRRLTTVNPVSALANRANFLEQAEPELLRARQAGENLAVLALQLDHFDQIKNRWGLQASDQAVMDVAALLRSQQCEQDLVGQIGDHEFALLMVNVDTDTAMERADAIRAGINELRGAFSASGHQLTASGGMTLLAPADRHPVDALLRAERALCLAQGNGQNQIAEILADPLEAESALG